MNNTTLNILLLEDDDALAFAMSKSLSSKGHSVSHVKNLAELEAMLQENFDLVLMDLKLENETSLQSIQDVRLAQPTAKIFMITAYASIATTVEAIKQGADDYLPKPITTEEILATYHGFDSEKDVAIKEEPLSTKRLEWEHIQRVLKEHDGNISRTAKALNMHRRTLQRKLQKKPVD